MSSQQKQTALEGEIVDKRPLQKQSANTYERPNRASSARNASTILSGLALLLSLFPVVGFILALSALILSRLQKRSGIVAMTALIISSIATSFWLIFLSILDFIF